MNNAGQNFPFCQLDRQYLSAVDELVSATLNNRPCEELEAFLKDRLEKHFPHLCRVATHEKREIDPKYNIIKVIGYARRNETNAKFLKCLFSYVFDLYANIDKR